MDIPIRNIYYLLCYAWNKLDEKDQVAVDIDDRTKILDLLAKILLYGTKLLLKRGIDKNYFERTEEIAAVKGRLIFSETVRKGLHLKQRAICNFDEYSSDTLLNQLLVTTLYRLQRTNNLDLSLKNQVRQLLIMFPEVRLIEIRKHHFKRLRLNRNLQFYGFLMNVCELIYESSLPSENKGEWKFMDFTRDEGKMNQLFEAFIRNFYQIEQSTYKVRRENIQWQFQGSEESMAYLPQMQTDISLENEFEKIIIDAKYYRETLSSHYGSEKLRSTNLYQLFSYLLNQTTGDDKSASAKGVLIYPKVADDYDLEYLYHRHKVCIKTVDLNGHWRGIHERLLSIIHA